MQPRALLIDGMGTLVALPAPAVHLVAELRARLGVLVTTEQAEVALRAEIAYYRSHLDEGSDPVALAGLRDRCAAVLRGALPASPALAAAAPGAVTDTLLAALRFRAHSDAAPALRRARAAGLRTVVVSNWDVSLVEVLERVGLAPLLDGVVTSAGAGARKPDPAIFAPALALAGVPAGACLHVGDSEAEDVAGARAAGIEPVLLDRDASVSAPARAGGVRVIASLDALAWP
jgi:putative hydrolase of the HAD superfamily